MASLNITDVVKGLKQDKEMESESEDMENEKSEEPQISEEKVEEKVTENANFETQTQTPKIKEITKIPTFTKTPTPPFKDLLKLSADALKPKTSRVFLKLGRKVAETVEKKTFEAKIPKTVPVRIIQQEVSGNVSEGAFSPSKLLAMPKRQLPITPSNDLDSSSVKTDLPKTSVPLLTPAKLMDLKSALSSELKTLLGQSSKASTKITPMPKKFKGGF